MRAEFEITDRATFTQHVSLFGYKRARAGIYAVAKLQGVTWSRLTARTGRWGSSLETERLCGKSF